MTVQFTPLNTVGRGGGTFQTELQKMKKCDVEKPYQNMFSKIVLSISLIKTHFMDTHKYLQVSDVSDYMHVYAGGGSM